MQRTLFAIVLSASAMSVHARNAHAQPETLPVDVCVAIDEARDGLSTPDRASALRLIERQFELAGWQVVPDGCSRRYVLSHIPLGEHIVVSLAGGSDIREAIALGLDDLPALYNQMVRSIVTGRPMTGFNVMDRTNVTKAQSRANRVHSDRFAYARLGYGGIAAERFYGTPSMGVGYRTELDAFGIDVSFLNLQAGGSQYVEREAASTFSLVKLQVLHFLKPDANASPYVGGGLSWGSTSFSAGANDRDTFSSYWSGNGLQGELTVGYELPRASTLRIFVEGNVVLPFYHVASERYSRQQRGGAPDVSRRYAPSVVASVGLGWQRDRGGYR